MGRQRWLLVLPVLVVSGCALLADTRWVGGWAGTVDRVSGTTVLTAPVLASVAAGIHLGVVRLRPISSTAVRSGWVPYRSAVEAWVLGLAAYGMVLGAAIVSTLAVPHGGPAQWWALAAGGLVLALASLFGCLGAHLFPHAVTVVTAGPVLFLLGAFGPAPLPEALRFGPTGDLTGLQLIPLVHLARVATAVGACLCLGVAMGAWRSHPRPRAWWIATVASAATTAAASVAVFHTATGIGDNRLEPSSEGPSACAGQRPEVCVAPSDRRFLDGARRAVERPADVLSRAGVDLPDRYQEAMPFRPAAEGIGEFSFDPRAGMPPFPASVRLLTHPAACAQWYRSDGPPYAALDAEQLIVEWAAVRDGGRAEAFSPEVARWLPHIDDPGTTAWVVATFAQLRSCDFNSIVMPWDDHT